MVNQIEHAVTVASMVIKKANAETRKEMKKALM